MRVEDYLLRLARVSERSQRVWTSVEAGASE